MEDYSRRIIERIERNPNIRDADTSLELGTPEIRIRADRERAAGLAVRAGDVSQALSLFIAGQPISTFTDGSDQYDVLLRADAQFRRERADLSGFLVQSSNGGTVDLNRVVRLEEGRSPSSIERLNRVRHAFSRRKPEKKSRLADEAGD